MYIHRTIEKAIKNLSRSFPCIVVYGPRQVGKSTTVDNIFSSNYKKVSLDDLEDRLLAETNPKLFLETYGWPLIIDEIQKVPKLLDEIKKRIDEQRLIWLKTKAKRQLMYILTGSQAYSLMENVSESLAGRVSIVEMSPLPLREIKGLGESPFVIDPSINQERSAENKIDINDLYEQIVKGFYPELYDNPNLETESVGEGKDRHVTIKYKEN